jgi:hypothetical protein
MMTTKTSDTTITEHRYVVAQDRILVRLCRDTSRVYFLIDIHSCDITG